MKVTEAHCSYTRTFRRIHYTSTTEDLLAMNVNSELLKTILEYILNILDSPTEFYGEVVVEVYNDSAAIDVDVKTDKQTAKLVNFVFGATTGGIITSVKFMLSRKGMDEFLRLKKENKEIDLHSLIVCK